MSITDDVRGPGPSGPPGPPTGGPPGGGPPPPRDGQYDKTPPQDVAAEQCVLGGMLLSKDAIADVVEILKSNDFYRPVHATIFDAILDLYGRGEPADPITVAAALADSGDLGRIGGAPYLHTLIASVPTAANAAYYARIVGRAGGAAPPGRGRHRASSSWATAPAAGGGRDVDDIVDLAQQAVYDVTERRVSEDFAVLADMLQPTLDEIEAVGAQGGMMTGVPTGFTDLDRLLNGLHAGQLIIVAGRPGLGKALALDTPLPTPTGWTTMGEVARRRPADRRRRPADDRHQRVRRPARPAVLRGRVLRRLGDRGRRRAPLEDHDPGQPPPTRREQEHAAVVAGRACGAWPTRAPPARTSWSPSVRPSRSSARSSATSSTWWRRTSVSPAGSAANTPGPASRGPARSRRTTGWRCSPPCGRGSTDRNAGGGCDAPGRRHHRPDPRDPAPPHRRSAQPRCRQRPAARPAAPRRPADPAVHARGLARRRAHRRRPVHDGRPGDRRLRRGRRLRRTAERSGRLLHRARRVRRAGRADVRRLRQSVPAPGDECAHVRSQLRPAARVDRDPARPAGLCDLRRRHRGDRQRVEALRRLPPVDGFVHRPAASGRRARRQAHPGGLPACLRGAAPRAPGGAARHRRHGRPDRQRAVLLDLAAARQRRLRARRQPRLPVHGQRASRSGGARPSPPSPTSCNFTTVDDVFRLERKRLAHKERRRATTTARTGSRYHRRRAAGRERAGPLRDGRQRRPPLPGRPVDDPDPQQHGVAWTSPATRRSGTTARARSSRWK